MFTPQQTVRLTYWFHVMEKEEHPDQTDIDILKKIVELLKDEEGSEGPEFITYKEYYKHMTEHEIPKLEKIYGDHANK